MPFTTQEKFGWTVGVILIPWLFWLPLIWLGSFVRTFLSAPPWYTGLWLTPLVLTVAYIACWIMLIDKPRVLRERLRRSPLHGDKPKEPLEEKLAHAILAVLLLSMVFVSSYDAAGMNDLSLAMHVLGSAMVDLSLVLVAWVLRENAFAAKVVYKQEGQVIITTGPYMFVRHPFYSFFCLFLVGFPLMIGSYWGVIPSLLCTPTLMWRAYHEEDFLVEEFGEEYHRYQQNVKWRMFPGIF